MRDTVRVALVGINGYGRNYLNHFREGIVPDHAELVGVIDTDYTACKAKPWLQENQIPMLGSLEEFFADYEADLVVISSPIHWHCRQSIQAVRHGAHVLCEKPVAATVQETREMMAAEAETGKFIAIGYQWSFSNAVQKLKQDIQRGRLGAPVRLRTMVCWPRMENYYKRNNWAGALKTSDGRWVLDSPVNNATAHYLHNMFYILGDDLATSAKLHSVTGELYRANPISNYDTATLRCLTDKDVEILFLSSHAVNENIGPVASYEFEDATVTIDASDHEGKLIAAFANGDQQVYGGPNMDQPGKLLQAIGAVRGENPIVCSVEAAATQTLCMNGLQDAVDAIVTVPQAVMGVQGEPGNLLTYISGMTRNLQECYDRFCLLSELGHLDWAKPGRTVDLRNYREFPGGGQPVEQATI